MNLKYLLEEHQKIYSWKYSDCQNIYLNQYPYAISINNEISSFNIKDIERFVLEVTNNSYLESAKAFDILSNTISSIHKRRLYLLSIRYYLRLSLDKESLSQGFLGRLSDLLFKIYKKDKDLNDSRDNLKRKIINWVQNSDNYEYLSYVANLDIKFSNEEKEILKKSYLVAIQHLFSLPFSDGVIQRGSLYLYYYDYAIALSNKIEENDIRKDKIDTLDKLAEIETDVYMRIRNKELALNEIKKLYKSGTENLEEEIIKRDKELKKCRLEWISKFSRTFNFFENNLSLKKEVEEEIKRLYQVTENGIKNSKKVEEALFIFINKKLPSYSNLIDRVKKNRNNSLIRLVATKTIIQKNGDSILVQESNDHDICDISSQYDLEVNFWYLSYLPRIFSLIKEKYSLEDIEKAIASLSKSSIIIFPERERQWFNCLLNGFKENFDISIGIVKQLENLIREILLEQDVNIYKSDFSSYLGFGSLLSKEELNDIFGEDHLAILRWLFQNVFGPSLRNSDAHGNLDDIDYDSGIMFFIWWFALRWCVLTVPWELE
ncbi:hypothetical protein LA56_1558 [Francisella philomiragia]|uniref:DUF4209 domain-containing protein n=1 Tax=Francisella philomiragia TaxID=28110 RepID=UPI0005A56189|nr:DUF4209 domain-containing protein [Francisella philomiragia]AJI54753.1 hypothetical protein LA56_1558 [Francisella philomiragia]MBK2253098.1 DUF4209 domain-containing protein [Francisella philomiragia]